MQRRGFMRGILSIFVLLIPGCFGRTRAAGLDGVDDIRFWIEEGETLDPDEEGVFASCEKNQLTIRRAIQVGSSECNEAKLQSVSFESDVLGVTVSYGDSKSMIDKFLDGGCTDDLSSDIYVAKIYFTNSLPRKVAATHEPYLNSSSKWETEIDC